MNKPRVWFLFNRPRKERADLARAGQWPDEGMYAFLALQDLGFETVFSDDGHAPSVLRSLSKAWEDHVSERGRRVGFNVAQAWTLRKRLAEADLIFATADSSALGALALKRFGLIKAPVVYASIGLADSFSGAAMPPGFYRRLIHLADILIHYGQGEGRLLQQLFGVSKDKLRFVPFGVQADFFKASSQRDGLPLAVGLDPRRDWPLLFEAIADTQLELELVCNRDAIRGYRVPAQIKLSAPLPMPALRDKMARSRFAVLPVQPSTYTGATMTLLQCMASGCATIVSETDAIRQGYGLEHESNVVLVPPGDAGALAGAMDTLWNNPEHAGQLGQAARKTIQRNHDIGRFAKDLAAVFRSVLA